MTFSYHIFGKLPESLSICSSVLWSIWSIAIPSACSSSSSKSWHLLWSFCVTGSQHLRELFIFSIVEDIRYIIYRKYIKYLISELYGLMPQQELGMIPCHGYWEYGTGSVLSSSCTSKNSSIQAAARGWYVMGFFCFNPDFYVWQILWKLNGSYNMTQIYELNLPWPYNFDSIWLNNKNTDSKSCY